MANAAMSPMNVPSGGLASFLTSNMDEIDDSVLAFGRGEGINSMRDVAERMAQMGRNGDNYVVHASEREMIVPREVVERNPELRNAIMRGIEAEGADPNAYVVGSDANSINPMTGQREFFLKKLVRGVKKAVKAVVNVVKKVAPIVLPVIGAMVLGPVVGTALGSAASTAIRGGNARDILKSAAIGGLTGGVISGVSGAIQGIQSGIGALPGAKAALSAAISPSNVFGNLGQRISERGFFRAYQGPDFAALAAEQAAANAPGSLAVTASSSGAPGTERTFMDRILGRNMPTSEAAVAAERTRLTGLFPNATPAQIDAAIMQGGVAGAGAAPTLLQRFGPAFAGSLALGALSGAFTPPAPQPIEIPGFDPEDTSEQRIINQPEIYVPQVPALPQTPLAPQDVLVARPQDYLPSAVTQPNIQGPAVPAFTPPVFQQPTPLPDIATIMASGSMPPASANVFGYDRFGNPIQSVYAQPAPRLQEVQTAATGGEMRSFPRRMGEISGPGTGTSDDVPAMLSDGEFVMTARAVRNAGNGDRREGVRKMYEIMRGFERGGAVA